MAKTSGVPAVALGAGTKPELREEGTLESRTKPKCGKRSLRVHQGTTTGETHVQVSDAPEVLAEELLKRPSCTRAEVDFRHASQRSSPWERRRRGRGLLLFYGVLLKRREYRPEVQRFFCGHQAACPFRLPYLQSMHFTTLSLFDGVKTPMHRDSRNGSYPNGVCPISDFSGEHIWIKEEGACLEMETPKNRRPGRHSCVRWFRHAGSARALPLHSPLARTQACIGCIRGSPYPSL